MYTWKQRIWEHNLCWLRLGQNATKTLARLVKQIWTYETKTDSKSSTSFVISEKTEGDTILFGLFSLEKCYLWWVLKFVVTFQIFKLWERGPGTNSYWGKKEKGAWGGWWAHASLEKVKISIKICVILHTLGFKQVLWTKLFI